MTLDKRVFFIYGYSTSNQGVRNDMKPRPCFHLSHLFVGTRGLLSP